MMRFLIFSFFVVAIMLACNQNANNKKENDTTVSVEKGKTVFKKYCISCHGADGTLGLNGAKNLAVSKLTKEEKIEVIANGRKTMLSFNGILQPNEIESVAIYIQGFAE